jgi:predicted phage terminase large subunit-like protein
METLTRPRKVLRGQATFLRSDVLYRGFVGGRGAGKSWVGAYDLARRARRGRTYLVGSPTGVLLHDTTYPTFKALAQELGLWGPVTVEELPEVVLTPTGEQRVKLTPYPTVELTTGATVRFRTAEDPEKLRGPNLSGCWLDEASLMSVEAFRVAIASLREQGEQGWLTATYTPRGFGNWTFDTFGRGKPNTFEVHAETRENCFNPPGFHDQLAQQYSGLRAEQELKGRYVNLEGAEWPAEYFGEGIWASLWPTRWVASALALDPAMGPGERGRPPLPGHPARPGCYAAFVFCGCDEAGVLWADAWLSQTWDAAALVAQTLALHRLTGAQAVSVETNGGQQFLAELILQAARARSITLPLWGVNQVENKEVRIRAKLGPFLAQGRMRFRRGSPGAELLVQQCRDFPVGEYVDGPDALQQAVVMLDHLLGAAQSGAQPRALRA